MTATDFFARIDPIDRFEDVFNPARYRPLPDDWLVAVCDIQDSTAGIAGGKYKEINMIGASAIIAVLNATTGIEIPYVFGGDGAGFAIPPAASDAVAAALQGTKDMAVGVFGLNLRAGLIPVGEVRATGCDVRVARYRLSPNVAIAMFDGGGLAAAETIIKDPARKGQHDLKKWIKTPAAPDFNGLACRWNPLKTTKGQIVTLIARAADGGSVDTYRDMFSCIQQICGASNDRQPVSKDKMSLAANPKSLAPEHGIQTHGKGGVARVGYGARMAWDYLAGQVLFKTGAKAGTVDGSQYVEDLVKNTDFQKFDDTLRMVMDNTPEQTAALLAYLDGQYKAGKIFYGAHIEEEAMITCLVFSMADRHLHFVDGAKGGYAAAARAMKEQMKAASSVQRDDDRRVV